MKLLAHLTLCDGVKIEQSLEKHCLKAAEYASRTLADSNLYYTGYLAGILHDMGKAKHSFNCYLEKAFAGEKVIPGSVNHTFAGVIWLFEKYHTKSASVFERLTCEVIGYAIGAHHGMFDCVNLDGKNGFEHRLKKEKAEIHYEEAVENYLDQVISEGELDECFQKAVSEIQTFFENARKQYDGKFEEVCFQVSMLTRLILSSVIYGDRRDTREFMTQHEDHGEDDVCWKIRKEYFENKIGSFDTVSRLNQVRSDISRQCLEFAQKPSGIYRLNVPTGAGKTLCTLRYALTHAEKYKKKRIIFVIPLLSVLEQNAKVLREYIGDEEIILEHHSNVIQENMQNEELDRYELLCTTWDAPVIITTLVQLLNTLFAGQTSAVGRMRALCDSIIVIDEVQSLPKKTTEMFNMAMNFLYHYCNAAIILSSATQPCFEELKWPVHLADHPDMVKLNENQMNVFDRSEIIDCTDPYGMDFDEWADFCKERMEHHHSLLVICNTKTEARTLFEEIQMIDALEELLRKIRPYKLEKGSANQAFEQAMDVLIEGMEQHGLPGAAKGFEKAIAIMREVAYDRSNPRPQVLIVGEYLLNFHPGANHDIEDYLEKNGFEIIEARMTDVIRKTYFYQDAQIKEYHLKKPLDKKVWYRTANSIFNIAHNVTDKIAVKHPLYEPACRMQDLVKESDPIIHHTFDAGEGVLIPGEILHHAKKGCRSFVILQPFGCLPNHVVGRGISKRLKELHPDAQILPLDYDPDVSFANIENRLQMLIEGCSV